MDAMFSRSLWSFIVLLSVQLAPVASFTPTAPRFERLSLPSTRTPLDSPTVSTGQKSEATPLWPGSRFTELDRARALSRGLRYIYRTALNPRNFAQHGSDYVWCFYSLSAAVQDEDLKVTAHRMGVERARHWRS